MDIFTVIITYMAILCVYKEREMLGCKDDNLFVFLSGTPACDNSNNQMSRLIREERPKNFFDVYKRVVIWRRSFLLSLLIVLVYHNVMDCKYDGIKMFVSIICGTFFIYFSFNFYQYHLYDYMEEDINSMYNTSLK
jgi:hypothetical protein